MTVLYFLAVLLQFNCVVHVFRRDSTPAERGARDRWERRDELSQVPASVTSWRCDIPGRESFSRVSLTMHAVVFLFRFGEPSRRSNQARMRALGIVALRTVDPDRPASVSEPRSRARCARGLRAKADVGKACFRKCPPDAGCTVGQACAPFSEGRSLCRDGKVFCDKAWNDFPRGRQLYQNRGSAKKRPGTPPISNSVLDCSRTACSGHANAASVFGFAIAGGVNGE